MSQITRRNALTGAAAVTAAGALSSVAGSEVTQERLRSAANKILVGIVTKLASSKSRSSPMA